MKYVHAEREGDFALHLISIKEMMSLFFADKHFIQGEHTVHLLSGIFNGIWSDMVIEITYMRHGHGKSGIVGLPLNQNALKVWAYSIQACTKVVNGLDNIRNVKDTCHTEHKEEGFSCIKSDGKARAGLHKKLDPLSDANH